MANRQRPVRRALAVVLLGGLVWVPSAAGANFTVNDTTDAALAMPTDTACASTDAGHCTLRAAIQAADNGGGPSTITLPPGTFTLSIAPSSSDDPSNGDLDVDAKNSASSPPAITLTGAGSGATRAHAPRAGHPRRSSSEARRRRSPPTAARR